MAVADHSNNTELLEEEDDYENVDSATGTAVEMGIEGDYNRLDIENVDDATYEELRTNPQNEITQSGISQHKWVGVGVGLLCAILALLNLAVPLYLHQSNMIERNQLQTRINNLTEERDDLLRRMFCESHEWQRFGRGCYYISTEMKNWTESRQWCRDRQSDLIVIKSTAEQDFVERAGKRVWLGLTDIEREGSFLWVDGTNLTTPTYWGNSQPDNHRQSENCVEFEPHFHHGWNDASCSLPHHWICEKLF